MEDPARHVSVAGIFELYGKSLEKARRLLDHLLTQPEVVPEVEIRTALGTAMLTLADAVTAGQRVWLDVLLQ